MGGLAFSSGPGAVATPRMKPEVYVAMRDRCMEKLRDLFELVASPLEGPAKTTFGDVDLFVALERKDISPPSGNDSADNASRPLKQAISDVLGAMKWKSEHVSEMTAAVPWPEDFAFEDNALQDRSPVNGTRPQGVQVDVHICETVDHLQWMLFKYAHGDIWNILGSVIRPIGLTIDDMGLYIRIPEIEPFNKKQAKILLSKDPGEVLRFLDLDNTQWEVPFESQEAIFEYATTCRFFWLSSHTPSEHFADAPTTGGTAATGGEGEESGRKPTSHDRRRVATRPLFRKWLEEYLPSLRAAGHFTQTPRPTRDTVRQLAFDFFPGTQKAYEERLKLWRISRQRDTLYRDVIKAAVPTDYDVHRRSCCAAALKKIVLHDDRSFGEKFVLPAYLKDADGLFDENALRLWIGSHWEAVAELAWKINMERHAASLARKSAAADAKIPVVATEEECGG
ncbi:hypothetical protein GGR50DRAFT_695107 [Xylaria sp. CBS 124048]|nr:hypothetical protein GGR50DRAFT_695107 [Xylaria sp. CBS 124048]